MSGRVELTWPWPCLLPKQTPPTSGNFVDGHYNSDSAQIIADVLKLAGQRAFRSRGLAVNVDGMHMEDHGSIVESEKDVQSLKPLLSISSHISGSLSLSPSPFFSSPSLCLLLLDSLAGERTLVFSTLTKTFYIKDI